MDAVPPPVTSSASGRARRDPDAIARAARWVERRMVPYHRARVLGVEHLPDGGCLLVGNHNGGFYTGDSYLLGAALHRARGLAGTPWVMTHDLGVRLLGRWLGPLGAVPADPATAAGLLRGGEPVLVYPGADADGARRWRDRHRVTFDGRVGFARLAIELGVPIVPVAAAGAHGTAVVLWDGAPLARLLRTHRWLRLSRWPLLLSVPWGLTFLPSVPYLPLPTRITVALGPPMQCERQGPEAAGDDAYVGEVAARVEAAVQAMLDELVDGHRRSGRRLSRAARR